MTKRRETKPIDPAALTPAEAARLLHVRPEAIRRDIGQGAPLRTDGRINLLHYAAWLVCRDHPGRTSS